ncbi:MAG: hypothetical protein D6722_26055 [Bacteroidetes bacterium]|nr:MAG: hypothetical protein D6722_26055 [Bacteroidota bacterium]
MRYLRKQETAFPEDPLVSTDLPQKPVLPIDKAPLVAVPPAPPTPSTRPIRFSAEPVKVVAPNRLRLSLRNEGDTLCYERVEPEAFNELSVTYDPAVFRGEERYAQGTALTFSLSGPEASRKSYHFQLFFSTLDGQRYRQEVAGVGQEAPILEPPVRLPG